MSDEDLELQKRIAAQAQLDSATAATPAVQAFQFFLVPLLIVGACVGVYLLLGYLVAHPSSPKELLEDLRHGGRSTRYHASLELAQALRRMDHESPDRTLTPGLLEVYRTSGQGAEEDKIRQFVARCLGFLRDTRASELLAAEAKKDQEVETRVACLDALGDIKDPSTLPALLELLDDTNPIVRKYAAFNAGAVAGEAGDRGAALEALRAKLTDPVPDVTWNVAFALAYFLGDRAGNDILKKMLDRKYLEGVIGDDPKVDDLTMHALLMACNATAKLGDGEFVPFLEARTDTGREPSPEVRYAAHQAINAIGKNR